jgi:type II secretory pathway component GspD/PulD (secretin)
MRYVVIINLDYQSHEHDKLKALFGAISKAMREQGFVIDGRRFTIDTDPQQAQQQARLVIEQVEQQYHARGESIYVYIKEFFGFEMDSAVNLLLPPHDDIEVSELEEIDGINLVNFMHLLNK